MRHIVVFDTNVVFSAIGWKGPPSVCLELARSRAVLAVTCRELLDELAEKLASKLAFGVEKTAEAIDELRSFMKIVVIPGKLNAITSDPDDNIVLECAIEARATHIVTGDRRHLLPLGNFQGIPILNPADFLAATSP